MNGASRPRSSVRSSSRNAQPIEDATDLTWQPGQRTPSTLSGDPSRQDQAAARALHPSLVIIWSREEPARVGEVLLVPPQPEGRCWRFGRGQDLAAPELLGFYRQRPGLLERTGPPMSPRISRLQLEILQTGPECLEVANLGRCPLLLYPAGCDPTLVANLVERAEVRPGDVLELKNELLLLCVLRPGVVQSMPEAVPGRQTGGRLPALPPDWSNQPFGVADVFGMVGESPLMWDLRRTIVQVAHQEAHVLILGSSGTGKELVARAIHGASRNRSRDIVSRNAATFPEGLIDAELFGNIKNYPNPGMPERPGLVGQANGSSLFLDEFAELPIPLQSHLLRVMDEGEYQRLGDSGTQHASFRLIAATNRTERHLKHDVRARLKSRIRVPDLNQRREDIPLLARHLLRRLARQDVEIARRGFKGESAEGEPRMTPELVRALVQHRYRTHVRELDALLLTVVMESRGRYFDVSDTFFRELQESAGYGPGAHDSLAAPLPSLEGSRRRESPRTGIEPEASETEFHSPGLRQTAAREGVSADTRLSGRSGESGIAGPAAQAGLSVDDGKLPGGVSAYRTASSVPELPPAPSPAPHAPSRAPTPGEATLGPPTGQWKQVLTETLQALLEAADDQDPDYSQLHALSQELVAAWVGRVHQQEQEKILSTARRLHCNRDVIRRLLEKKS